MLKDTRIIMEALLNMTWVFLHVLSFQLYNIFHNRVYVGFAPVIQHSYDIQMQWKGYARNATRTIKVWTIIMTQVDHVLASQNK